MSTKIKILGCILVSVIALSFVLMSFGTEETVTNQTEVQPEPNPIAVRTMEIMNSVEFQDEMMSLATARALYEMSNEKQKEAVDLSEMALMSYQKSNELANNWKQKHDGSTSVE